jgi:hypothetical protein
MKLYNIRQLNVSTISSIIVSDISGSVELVAPYDINLSAYSTLTAVDLSGVSTIYEIAKPISIQNIMSSNKALVYQEEKCKKVLLSLDLSVLQNNLYVWGSKGFPDSYVVYTFNLDISDYTSSDGITRNSSEYIDFVLGNPIKVLIDSYQSNLKSIRIDYSIQENPLIVSLLATSDTSIACSGAITLDTIQSTIQELKRIEKNNHDILQNLDYDTLETNLHIWGIHGYSDSYLVYEFILTEPEVVNGRYMCSDGVLRDVWEYIVFVLGSSIQTMLDIHQLNLQGITLGFSVKPSPITLGIHAIRSV